MNEQDLQELEKKLSEKFPFGIPRKEIGRATGNVLHPRTCANDDCSGQGVSGRFKIGRNTVYPVQGVVDFIKSKTNAIA
jgi:hypothetical protein